jgi:predicted DNA-binding protein (MmcQ/YjbR family)
MFALSALDARPLSVSLKCEPSLAEALRAKHPAVRPEYHLNKRHWITVTLDDSLPDELVFGLLEDSYELVVNRLPKRERDLVRSSALRSRGRRPAPTTPHSEQLGRLGSANPDR